MDTAKQGKKQSPNAAEKRLRDSLSAAIRRANGQSVIMPQLTTKQLERGPALRDAFMRGPVSSRDRQQDWYVQYGASNDLLPENAGQPWSKDLLGAASATNSYDITYLADGGWTDALAYRYPTIGTLDNAIGTTFEAHMKVASGPDFHHLLAITHTLVTADLTNWPIAITQACLPDKVFSYATSNQITFTGEDMAPLSYELVNWDNANRSAELHVLVPSISSTTDTIVSLWYGSAMLAASPDLAGQQAVWPAGVAGAYHLQATLAGATGANIYKESVAGGQGLDYVSATGKAGKVGAGQQFDGIDDLIGLGTSFQATLRGSFSVACWIKPDDGQPAGLRTAWGVQCSATAAIRLYLTSQGKVGFQYESNDVVATAETSAVVYADGAGGWKHVVCVADATIGGVGGLKVYIDGVAQALGANNGSTAGCNFSLWADNGRVMAIGCRKLGAATAGELWWAGYIDEWRIYASALSLAEVRALYHNQSNPGTFINQAETQVNFGTRLQISDGARSFDLYARPSTLNIDDANDTIVSADLTRFRWLRGEAQADSFTVFLDGKRVVKGTSKGTTTDEHISWGTMGTQTIATAQVQKVRAANRIFR